MSGTGHDFEQMSREDLIRRLKAAEIVCVLSAWAPAYDVPADAASPDPDRGMPPLRVTGQAANMALAAWRTMVGPEVVEPACRGDVLALVETLAAGGEAIEQRERGP